jgi:putative CocE/NonD family hydrolase
MTGGSEAPPLRRIRVIENLWIPMPDGVKLAARLWLPEDAEAIPVPALLEYIPYRKRDDTRLRDETQHPWLAARGYACIRVDIRGSGDSEGLPQDEYVKQEQDDGVEIIAWLAAQPWCTGQVGMFGVSWGGYSALQVAARRPPALRAIITHCSTDDRYRDGDHWMGGCIEETFFTWGIQATLLGARPPDPEIVGARWRDMWMARLRSLEFYAGNWLARPHRDAYWKHASIAEDYGAIECAVYAVGGWADHFNNTVARMLERLGSPRKGLVGPWNHAYPHLSALGPVIGWLEEALRWWDHWLKDRDTGIMDEPMYRVWMQHEAAMRGMSEVPGHWVAEDVWPSPRIRPLTYFLTETGLDRGAGGGFVRRLQPVQTVGITAPVRYYRSDRLNVGLPADQRVDDARSLAFDSPPLAEDLEIMGAPIVTLDLAVDKPVAFLAVRLNEVEPDGLSKRVSFAMLNLTQRNGDERPELLEPGQRIRVRVPLHQCAERFKTGHRLRLVVSTAYWPAFWPSPEPVTLTLHGGQIELPSRPSRAEDGRLRPFAPVHLPKTSGRTTLVKAKPGTSLYQWDAALRKLTIRSTADAGTWRLDATGTEMSAPWIEETQILDHDPASARIDIRKSQFYRRGDWDVRIEAMLRLTLTPNEFLLAGAIKAFEQGREVFQNAWDRRIPRRMV